MAKCVLLALRRGYSEVKADIGYRSAGSRSRLYLRGEYYFFAPLGFANSEARNLMLVLLSRAMMTSTTPVR